MKRDAPDDLQKLVVVQGDITLPALGISPDDLNSLKECVSVVFHVAARIKFDEDLKSATEINVKGTRRVLEMVRQLPLLKVSLSR